jgi:glycosyltransferase involved in cell wall biosynthesis
LVGSAYSGKDELVEMVGLACAADSSIKWHGAVSDEALLEFYARAAFTTYASIVEGFGLPILESLWLATPCICHSGGVMAELAEAGGCLTVDVGDAEALSAMIERLADDSALRATLTHQATTREIKTWSEYASELSCHMFELAAQ